MTQLDIMNIQAPLNAQELVLNFFKDAVSLSGSQTWTKMNSSRLSATACCQLLIEIVSPVGELMYMS